MTFRETIEEYEEQVKKDWQHPYHRMEDVLNKLGIPLHDEDGEYIEHRVCTQYKNDMDDYDTVMHGVDGDEDEKTYNPYHQDFTKYPELFKMYGENYHRYQMVRFKIFFH